MTKSLISGKENAAKTNDKTVEFQNPAFRDEMNESIRAHAQTAIRQAVLAELEAFPGEQDGSDLQGRQMERVFGLHNALESAASSRYKNVI